VNTWRQPASQSQSRNVVGMSPDRKRLRMPGHLPAAIPESAHVRFLEEHGAGTTRAGVTPQLLLLTDQLRKEPSPKPRPPTDSSRRRVDHRQLRRGSRHAAGGQPCSRDRGRIKPKPDRESGSNPRRFDATPLTAASPTASRMSAHGLEPSGSLALHRSGLAPTTPRRPRRTPDSSSATICELRFSRGLSLPPGRR